MYKEKVPTVWCLKIPQKAMPPVKHRWFFCALMADPHVAKVERLKDESELDTDEWVVVFREGHDQPQNTTLHRLGRVYRSELNPELHTAIEGSRPKSRYEILDQDDDIGV